VYFGHVFRSPYSLTLIGYEFYLFYRIDIHVLIRTSKFSV